MSYRPFTAMLVWSVFYQNFPKCLFVIIVIHSYFSYISQGSVEMRLWCGGIYNYRIIANCSQSVPVKNFENQSIIGEDMDKSKVPRFYEPPCMYKLYTVLAYEYIQRQS